MKALFTGDTLFEGTVGRTDLPGSEPGEMKKSLKKIMTLFPDYTIYPGHDGPSTMKQEMETNPFLRRLAD
jgi:hydroxyacylglutathione hydrolase